MKTLLYMAVSVDGYIAREDDDTSWVSDAEWALFVEHLKAAGNAIVGHRNFSIVEKEESFPFKELFVVGVSSQEIESNSSNVVWAKSPQEALEILKEKGFETALVSGGGELNGSFLKEGLIDEIYLDVEPIVLGKGIRLFGSAEVEAKFELIETKKISTSEIQLHYKVSR